MITVTVKHHFSAGHRIDGLPGPGAKCANLHGHTFGVEWTYQVESLNADTFEFAAVKRTLRALVDEYFDHGYILGAEDEYLARWMREQDYKVYTLRHSWPTTEAIAVEIASWSNLPGAQLLAVTVTEGPHNAASWRYEEDNQWDAFSPRT